MGDFENKNLDDDGVLIRKKNNSAKEVKEEEIPIDALDGRKKDVPKKEGVHETMEKITILTPREQVEDLSDEEIKSLLDARNTLEEQRAILEEKDRLLVEYEDLLKRKQAEFENFRKRVQKESEDYKKYAISEIVLDIITVIDNFERALSAAESSKDFTALHEGIIMIEKQLRDLLERKYEVKMIETVGREFDPSLHDAIMMEESEEYGEDMVVEDFQKGYIMHDRVIRPAKVKVAKAVSSTVEGNNTHNDNEEERSGDTD
jgi:molecular chaperone GrpE